MAERVRLLLVEDDEEDARLLPRQLEEDGEARYEVTRAPTLRQACEAAARHPFDVAVLDMSLPDSDGLDAVRALAAAAPRLAILILTGRDDAAFAAEAVQAGAHGYAVKGRQSGLELGRALRRAMEQRRRVEVEELRRREALMRDFIANVSHEFRTPVAAIRGFAETLRSGALDDRENRLEFVQIIERQAARLSRLVEDLLQLSTLDAGVEKPKVSRVELKPFAARLLRDVAPLAARKQLALGEAVPPALAARADPELLERAVLNLVRNAIDYNKPGGRVEIGGELKGTEALLWVSDTGMGIPPAELREVFQRFHRSERARSRNADGTGLGLMIAKSIAEAHGGRIWADSPGVGQGATFYLSLPAAPA